MMTLINLIYLALLFIMNLDEFYFDISLLYELKSISS